MGELRSNNDNPESSSPSPETNQPEVATPSESDKERLSPQENDAAEPKKACNEKNSLQDNSEHPKLEAGNGDKDQNLENNNHDTENNEHGKLTPDQPKEENPEQPKEQSPEQPKEQNPEQPKEQSLEGSHSEAPNYRPNSLISTPEGRIATDDTGKPYMYYDSDNGQWQLNPNTKYQSNGYDYTTDGKGRIVHAEGDLRLKDGDRSPLNAKVEDMKPGDDRGHIIGDQFDGSNKIDNLSPQLSNVNRGEFKAHEGQLAKALDEGKPVHVSYDLSYGDDSKRPNGLIADYTVGNDRSVRIFEN